MSSYNPYKQALSLLQEKLILNNIPEITDKIDPKLTSSSSDGFDVDGLRSYLKKFQKENFKPKRILKQYSAYEILQCLRCSYYNRLGAPYDESKNGQYPFSTIKATVGSVVEKLVLSMQNQIEGTKYRNGIWIDWATDKEFGLLFPMKMQIDAISYDESIISDVKFTDQFDDFHFKQVKLYAQSWESIHKKECVKMVEVIYVNSLMNAITRKAVTIDGEVRDKEFPKTIERLKFYDRCLRENILPGKETNNCNFCVYKNVCSNEWNQGQVELNSLNGNSILSDVVQLNVGDETKENEPQEIKMENQTKKPCSNIKILL